MTTVRRLTVVGAALGAIVLGATKVAISADVRPDYKVWIEETGIFLREAVDLYKRGNARAAKAKAEAAYFEVYENLEGPIRINISAKKNYELEEEFVSLRKMIVEAMPAAAIEQRTTDFLAKLRAVAPALEGGVDLVAESAPEATEPREAAREAKALEIEPVWRQALHGIESGLETALDTYKAGDAKKATELAIQTQYDHYKNSLLETAVRRFVSQKEDFHKNSLFSEVASMMRDGSPPAAVEMRISALMQSLHEDLPGLPVVDGAISKREAKKAAESSLPASDWPQVAATLVQEIDKATAP